MSHSDIFRRKFKKNDLSYRELDIDANIPDAGQTMNVTESLAQWSSNPMDAQPPMNRAQQTEDTVPFVALLSIYFF